MKKKEESINFNRVKVHLCHTLSGRHYIDAVPCDDVLEFNGNERHAKIAATDTQHVALVDLNFVASFFSVLFGASFHCVVFRLLLLISYFVAIGWLAVFYRGEEKKPSEKQRKKADRIIYVFERGNWYICRPDRGIVIIAHISVVLGTRN